MVRQRRFLTGPLWPLDWRPPHFFWRPRRLESVAAPPGARTAASSRAHVVCSFVLLAHAFAARGTPALLGAEKAVERVDRGPCFPRAERGKGQGASAVQEQGAGPKGPESSPERRSLVRGREGNK